MKMSRGNRRSFDDLEACKYCKPRLEACSHQCDAGPSGSGGRWTAGSDNSPQDLSVVPAQRPRVEVTGGWTGSTADRGG